MSELSVQEQLNLLTENQTKQAEAFEKLLQENTQLKSQLGKVVGAEDATVDAEPVVPTETFKSAKKTYKFETAKFIIPGIGQRTALEVLVDDTKYSQLKGKTIKDWLASVQSAVISEVAE